MIIAIIAYNRPNYLYITLDSLSRNVGYNKNMVCVYTDGGGSGISEVCNVFGVKYVLQKHNIGNLDNIMFSLRDAFSYDDRVVLLEEDHILRQDTILHCLNYKEEYNFLSLCGECGCVGNGYRAIGNIFSKKLWNDIDRWMSNGEYFGKQKHGQTYSFSVGHKCYDSIFYTYAIYNNIKTVYTGWYVAHFGLEGLNQGAIDKEGQNIKDFIFSSNRTDWLNNVLMIFSDRDKLSDRYRRVFIPKEFNY